MAGQNGRTTDRTRHTDGRVSETQFLTRSVVCLKVGAVPHVPYPYIEYVKRRGRGYTYVCV